MSMAVGNAKGSLKTCLPITTSGIWLTGYQSLCFVCKGHWSCGRGWKEKGRKKKEGKPKKEYDFV
jgi:hypothetical protein